MERSIAHQVVDALGGVAATARVFDIATSSVSGWLKSGVIPSERVYTLYERLGGAFTPHQMCPRVFKNPNYRPPLPAADGSATATHAQAA